MLPNSEVFLHFFDYVGEADLGKGNWKPEIKLRVVKHFFEIIKQQLLKQKHPCNSRDHPQEKLLSQVAQNVRAVTKLGTALNFI